MRVIAPSALLLFSGLPVWAGVVGPGPEMGSSIDGSIIIAGLAAAYFAVRYFRSHKKHAG
jgi:hypothetical protein